MELLPNQPQRIENNPMRGDKCRGSHSVVAGEYKLSFEMTIRSSVSRIDSDVVVPCV